MRKIIYTCLFSLFILMLVSCTRNTPAPVVAVPINHDYTVSRGETLYSIAWRYDLNFQDLARWNHLGDSYTVKVGQRLKLSGPVQQHREITPKRIVKRVKVISPKTKKTEIKTYYVTEKVKNWRRPAQGRIVDTYSSRNKGINIAGRYGEPIKATASGVVVYSGNGLPGYGNLIIVKHNNQYLSAYGYNAKLLVREGQKVRAGQQIATMGKTNYGKTLLHFEIRRYGKPVNPMHYI